jgi:2-methylcitrate dehydratase PrpD
MARNTQVSADHNAPPVTRILAQFVATHPSRGWSDAVDHEAHRTFMNWLGCAVGASHHEAADAALAAVKMLQPAPQASVLGRAEKVDMANAALINGITSHTFDFDDTHLKTIIHPAGPVASAVLALAEHTGASGREMIDALVLGIDVSCRVGNAMYPDHYDRGWHITGSTGTLGAAAACARLLKLDVEKTTMALGIAASQPVGMREQFGSMTKPFHPGGAARAGLMSALLAQQGFTASPRALEAPRGMMQTVSTKNDWNEINGELGQRFEIAFNSYKPFACGIVIHPSIDACARLRAQGVRPDQVERIELKVHSLVLELTGKKEPADGLQAKFSVYHGCAAGLTFGCAGEDEFLDEIVNRDDMVALRRKVVATVDDTIDEASADVTAVLTDGRRLHVSVEHAIGSLQNPMTDVLLEAKFHGLSDRVLGAGPHS